MARTDVKWAGSLLSAERGANAGYALGPPDGDEWVCVTPESATFGDWRRATYDDLDFA